MSEGPTRVLIVGPSLRYLGGQAVQAERLMKGLRTIDGLEIEYLVVDPVLPKPLAWLQRISLVRTVATTVAYVWSLLRRVPKADTVHAFSASYWSFLLAPVPAMCVGRLFGKRVLLNYHSGEADDHLTRWGWHAKPLMRLADAVVVPTDFLVDVFARHGIPAIAIAKHLDVTRMQARHRDVLRPKFLSNRNFETHYNVRSILDAFRAVQSTHADAELVVAGNGSLRGALEAQARELELRNVHFTGPVQPEDMAALYNAADVYVNASLIDNMPLSLLEAYASCLPVVTSDAGGIPWIARDGDTARVVPAGDTLALASAMLDVVADQGPAQQRAARARRYVEEEFSWAEVGPKWKSVYVGPPSAPGRR
ncbi:MAG: glycosyltransferase family 4 protein [Gemmatimonadaceae bacterium]|nr:glycosyltransferase family 4 protein [Gemmatimonadaceae bacterium]